MNSKNTLLCLVMAALATVYVIYFTDWFRHKTLHIYHTDRNLNPERGAASGLIFGLEGNYTLKEIKLVPLAAYQSNPNVVPLWHLTAKSHSEPLKYFYYGQQIDGMAPLVNGEQAQPLEYNVAYRIFINTGKLSGHHDFTLAGPADGNAAH